MAKKQKGLANRVYDEWTSSGASKKVVQTMMLILVLSGLASSQTVTVKEEEQVYRDGCCRTRLETPSAHEARLSREAASAQAKADREAALQAEQRAAQREADKIAAQNQEVFLATPEGQRQAKLEYEAKQKQAEAGAAQERADNELIHKMWLVKHPEYSQTDANNALMDQYIDAHDLDWRKTKSYDKAFKALSKAGLLANR